VRDDRTARTSLGRRQHVSARARTLASVSPTRSGGGYSSRPVDLRATDPEDLQNHPALWHHPSCSQTGLPAQCGGLRSPPSILPTVCAAHSR